MSEQPGEANVSGCAGSGRRITSDELACGEPVYSAMCPSCEYEVNAYRDEDGWYLVEHADNPREQTP